MLAHHGLPSATGPLTWRLPSSVQTASWTLAVKVCTVLTLYCILHTGDTIWVIACYGCYGNSCDTSTWQNGTSGRDGIVPWIVWNGPIEVFLHEIPLTGQNKIAMMEERQKQATSSVQRPLRPIFTKYFGIETGLVISLRTTWTFIAHSYAKQLKYMCIWTSKDIEQTGNLSTVEFTDCRSLQMTLLSGLKNRNLPEQFHNVLTSLHLVI